MLIADTFKEYLDASNLIGDYRYLSDFDESDYADEYTLVSRQTPTGSDDVHSLDAEFELTFITPQNKQPDAITKVLTDATLVRQYIFDNFRYDCIINTRIMSEPSGPFYLDSGRLFYRINVRIESNPSTIYG